jgi:hypothetical protein
VFLRWYRRLSLRAKRGNPLYKECRGDRPVAPTSAAIAVLPVRCTQTGSQWRWVCTAPPSLAVMRRMEQMLHHCRPRSSIGSFLLFRFNYGFWEDVSLILYWQWRSCLMDLQYVNRLQ